jgi:hypothetical protein
MTEAAPPRLLVILGASGAGKSSCHAVPTPRSSKARLSRLDGTVRALRIDDALVLELLTDIDKGGAKNADRRRSLDPGQACQHLGSLMSR